jgi:hypothetical protein
MAKVQSFQFGYMNSSKRSSQNFLIPIVMAVIDLESKDFPQGYVLVAPATDNPKLVPVLRAASPGRSVKRG